MATFLILHQTCNITRVTITYYVKRFKVNVLRKKISYKLLLSFSKYNLVADKLKTAFKLHRLPSAGHHSGHDGEQSCAISHFLHGVAQHGWKSFWCSWVT